ncbi:MAG: NlpC/P60 family protein [Leuconostoc falkenbergense]
MQNNYLQLALNKVGQTYNDRDSGRFVSQQLIHAKMPVNDGTRWSAEPEKLIEQMDHLLGVLQATPGDILFWGTQTKPYEVGIYVGGSHFIAVHRQTNQVRIQTLSKNWYPSIAGSII